MESFHQTTVRNPTPTWNNVTQHPRDRHWNDHAHEREMQEVSLRCEGTKPFLLGFEEEERKHATKRYVEESEWLEMQGRIRTMKLVDLRIAMRERGLSPAGSQEFLVERLLDAIKKEKKSSVAREKTKEDAIVIDRVQEEDRNVSGNGKGTHDGMGDMFSTGGVRPGYHAIGGVRQAPGGNSNVVLG